MRKAIIALLLALSMPALADSDQERVKAVIEKSAPLNLAAESAYNSAMASFKTIQSGKASKIVGMEMGAYAQVLDVQVIQLALLITEDVPNVNNAKAKENLEKGITGIYNVNKTRHGFVSGIAEALSKDNLQALQAVSSQFSERMNGLESAAFLALLRLASAKQAVGLPPDMNEFK